MCSDFHTVHLTETVVRYQAHAVNSLGIQSHDNLEGGVSLTAHSTLYTLYKLMGVSEGGAVPVF